MKLLCCKHCQDIFNLSLEEKKCSCGKVGGNYIDTINVVYFGDPIFIGFTNESFLTAVESKKHINYGSNFIAFIIHPDNPKFIKRI